MACAWRALYGQANGAELFLLCMGALSLCCSFCWNGLVIFFFLFFLSRNGSLHFLATCIKSLNVFLYVNHFTKLLISHCMQLGNYLFVLLAYYIPHAFGAAEKFALNVFPYVWTYLSMVYNCFEKECIKHIVALGLLMSWEVGIYKQLKWLSRL